VIAKPKEPLYTARAHDPRIPALAQECAPGPDLASLNSPMNHLTPRDVAAGPMPGPGMAGFGAVNPAMAAGPDYTCDMAGSCSPRIPLQVVAPPPVPSCGPNGIFC
jgi:hypothetical protein